MIVCSGNSRHRDEQQSAADSICIEAEFLRKKFSQSPLNVEVPQASDQK
jgi:hypothetical protein